MDFPLPDCQSLQSVMIFLALVPESLGPPAWAESVRELVESKNALAVEFLSLLLLHIRQQAQVIFFQRLVPASALKFTFVTMAVERKVGRRTSSQQRR